MKIEKECFTSLSFVKAGKQIKDKFRKKVEKAGLMHGHAMVLHVLSNHENMSQIQIAKVLEIKPASISPILQCMQKEGSIERKSDPNDDRTILVSLTEKGVEQAQRVVKFWKEVEKEIFASFSKEEIEQLSRTIKRIMEISKE